MSVIEAKRKELNRLQVDLQNRIVSQSEQEKQITAQLDELSARRLVIQEADVNLQNKHDEVNKLKVEVEEARNQSKRVLDEAKAEKGLYEDLKVKLQAEKKGFADREASISASYAEIETEKDSIKERSRQVLIAESKIREMKIKLMREIEGAKIEKEHKDRLMGDAQKVETIS